MSEHTRHHTNYELTFEGKAVDEELLLADLISNASQKNLVLTLRLTPYTERAIKRHLQKIRAISALAFKQSFGLNAGVSKLGGLELQPPVSQQAEEEQADKKVNVPARTFEEKSRVAEIISGFFENLPQGYYTPVPVTTPALRALYYGPYNPVPLNFRAKGHLAYIVVQTFENEIIHITATTSGFFANKSSNNKFDPSPRDNVEKCFTLFELISEASKNFLSILKTNSQATFALDSAVVAQAECAFLANPWITKPQPPTADFGRDQFEDNSYKDYNHEFQSFRDMAETDLQDRILKEKLLIKCAYDFTVEATKTALGVLNGAYAPMNPEEPAGDHIFLQNGIFYSFGADIGNFTEKGGDAAARASTNQDLQAIKYINTVNARGTYTLMTTIVDYAGKRVVCQTPVPGLFTTTEVKETIDPETKNPEYVQGDALINVAYGLDDITGNIETDKEFVKDLELIRKNLHFKKKAVGKGYLVTSADVKGMRGTDKRKYILDLYNATPLDIEFIEKNYDVSSELSYPHRQTVIRMEAVQDWWTSKVRNLIDEEAKKLGIDLSAKLAEGEKPPTVTVDQDQLLFTVDAFTGENNEDANVRDLSRYITKTLLPRFLAQYEQVGAVAPTEGAALSSQLHKSGINVRYLGYLAAHLEEKITSAVEAEEQVLENNVEHNADYALKLKEREEKIMAEIKAKNEAEKKGEKYDLQEVPELELEDISVPEITASKQYQHILNIATLEMVARASKHILRSYAKTLPLPLLPSLVAHFHNVLLGSAFNANPVAYVEEAEVYAGVDLSFTKLTPESVKEAVAKDVKIHYRYDLPSDWTTRFGYKQLQREIAVKFGIQWNQRQYFFNNEQYEAAEKTAQNEKKTAKQKVKGAIIPLRSEVFEPKDVSFAPIIKHTIPRSATAEQFFDAGHMSTVEDNKEKKQNGLELISESITIYEQVYGELHPEVQKIYAALSHLYQETGDKKRSALAARKAAYISERVYGVDSHDTFVSLLNLAYLELDCGALENSLKVYARLSQLWADVYDNRHISISSFFTSSIFNLQEEGYAKEATVLVKKLVALSTELHGEQSYATAHLKFRLAFLYAIQEKFDECITYITEAQKDLVKVASEKNFLTQQAGSLLKKISAWKEVNELTAKNRLSNEKAQREKEADEAKKVKDKKPLDGLSLDEVLEFVNGKSGKKGKKGNRK